MRVKKRLLTPLKKLYFPQTEIQLLQTADIAPIGDARLAWNKWRQLGRLDDIGWQEQKILTRMCSRIRELDPDYIYTSRIIGISKFQWTQSQFCLKESLKALDLLILNQYETMIFKGSAGNHYFELDSIRLSADLDILVRENDFIRSVKLLESNGWKAAICTSWKTNAEIPIEIHAVNLKNDRGGNIDIHRRPLHLDPGSKYIDGVWERSHTGTFMQREVRYCSRADYLALLIAHGLGKSTGEEMSSLWPGDFHRCLNNLDCNSLNQFRSIIQEMKISLECELALSYCCDQLKSEKIMYFSNELGPLDVSILDLIRSIGNSTHASTRWTLLWVIVRVMKRIQRYSFRLQNTLSKFFTFRDFRSF